MSKAINIEESWKSLLKEEFEKSYFDEIRSAILKSKAAGKNVFPSGNLIFNAFNSTPVQNVKVVILGQDPYHRPDQAMGLSFSVPPNMNIPPSLKNIYKELKRDIDFDIPYHGDLTSWAHQGVFLLNAFLTVEEGNAGSHSKIGCLLYTSPSPRD